MKLYTVEIKTDIVVYADSPAEAERLAREQVYEVSYRVLARDLTTLPNGWKLEDVPYIAEPADAGNDFIGEVEGKPIGLLIEEGAAPKWRDKP